MVNKFNKLSLQGKSLGKLTYVGRNKVGINGDISVAVLTINDTLNTENITPQAGFNFAKPFSCNKACQERLTMMIRSVLLQGWFDTKTQKLVSIKINTTN